MNRLVKIVAVLGLAISTTACATITRGTTDAFIVETTPSAAKVKTSNGFACDATPCSFDIPRKSGFTVTVSKPGYETTTHTVTSSISTAGGAGMAGNLVFGGVIGAVVDGTSGAMNDLKPNPLIVVMEPENSSSEMIETSGEDNS